MPLSEKEIQELKKQRLALMLSAFEQSFINEEKRQQLLIQVQEITKLIAQQ